MTEKNLFLIGYRGTGKTTIGKAIAKELKTNFIDVDEEIVKITGKKIPEIFALEGEKEFRKYETQALIHSINKETKHKVISCGGGIITKKRNLSLLKNNGIVFLLTSDPKTIFNRIYKDKNRPALTDKDPFEEIVHMLKKREKLYKKAKDYEIDTSKESINECAKKIMDIYLENKLS